MSDRPWVSFDEAVEKIPLPEVLEVYGIRDRFVEKNGRYSSTCPLPLHQHRSEIPNRRQFQIDKRTGRWLYKCWGDCKDTPHGSGNLIQFIAAMEGFQDLSHVRLWLANRFGDRLNLRKPPDTKSGHKKEACGNSGESVSPQAKLNSSATVANAPSALKPLNKPLSPNPDVEYLRQRGLSDEVVRRYGIGTVHNGYFRGYIVFPLFDFYQPDANPVSYIGRVPREADQSDPNELRYKCYKDFCKSHVLFGITEALRESDGHQPLVLVEGPIAAMYLVDRGWSAVASLGSSLSDQQAEILARAARPVIVCYDEDEAGIQGRKHAVAKLSFTNLVGRVRLPRPGTQPDHLSTEELHAVLDGF